MKASHMEVDESFDLTVVVGDVYLASHYEDDLLELTGSGLQLLCS